MAPRRNKQKKEKKEPEKKNKNEELSMADSSSRKQPQGKVISLQENKISEAQKNRGENLVKTPPEIPRKILQNSTDEAPASSKKKNEELVKDSSSQKKFKGDDFSLRGKFDECQSTTVSSISNIQEACPVNTETRTGDGKEISIQENFPDEETRYLPPNLEFDTKEDLEDAMEILLAAYGERKRFEMQRDFEKFVRNQKIVETKRKILHDLSISDEPSTSLETWNKEGVSLPDEKSNLELLRQKVKRIIDRRREQIIERRVDKSKNSNESKGKQLKQKEENPSKKDDESKGKQLKQKEENPSKKDDESKGKQLKQKEENPSKKDDESRQSSLLTFWVNAKGIKISEECSNFQELDDLAKSLLNLNVQLDSVRSRSEFLLNQQVHKASEGKGDRKNGFPAITPGETSSSKEQECNLSEAEIHKMIEELIWIGRMMTKRPKASQKEKEPEA